MWHVVCMSQEPDWQGLSDSIWASVKQMKWHFYFVCMFIDFCAQRNQRRQMQSWSVLTFSFYMYSRLHMITVFGKLIQASSFLQHYIAKSNVRNFCEWNIVCKMTLSASDTPSVYFLFLVGWLLLNENLCTFALPIISMETITWSYLSQILSSGCRFPQCCHGNCWFFYTWATAAVILISVLCVIWENPNATKNALKHFASSNKVVLSFEK